MDKRTEKNVLGNTFIFVKKETKIRSQRTGHSRGGGRSKPLVPFEVLSQ